MMFNYSAVRIIKFRVPVIRLLTENLMAMTRNSDEQTPRFAGLAAGYRMDSRQRHDHHQYTTGDIMVQGEFLGV